MEKQDVNKDTHTHTDALAQEFVQFAVECGVLKFGEFKTKAGRISPYFFNAGLFDDGAKLGRLAEFYAQRLIASGIEFDMVFGPAYKGIPLGAALSVELARRGRNVPFAYNRKEAKDHGEGGTLVGAPLQGRVLIVDDVMSAGTASARIDCHHPGRRRNTPCGVDRIGPPRKGDGERPGRTLQRCAICPQSIGATGIRDCESW